MSDTPAEVEQLRAIAEVLGVEPGEILPNVEHCLAECKRQFDRAEKAEAELNKERSISGSYSRWLDLRNDYVAALDRAIKAEREAAEQREQLAPFLGSAAYACGHLVKKRADGHSMGCPICAELLNAYKRAEAAEARELERIAEVIALRRERPCQCCGQRSGDETKVGAWCGECEGGHCKGEHAASDPKASECPMCDDPNCSEWEEHKKGAKARNE